MQEAASASRVLQVWNLLSQHQPALARAEEAAQIAPDYIYGQWALGDAAAAAGNKDEARTAYQKALAQAAQVEPERRSALTAPIQAALSKL
jgi:tetratricopeptide (TPR) repeat protein